MSNNPCDDHVHGPLTTNERILAASLMRAHKRLAAVEALHYPEAKHGTWCEQDKEHWPCATILALNASSSEAPA